MASALVWSNIFERMTNRDKDFRYMATSDALKELEKDAGGLEVETQRKLCQALIKILGDVSGDIRGLAVKCIGVLVTKMPEALLEKLADDLCTLVLSSDDDKRDIAGITLKTVLANVSPDDAGSAVKTIARRLIEGIKQSKSVDVQLECLDLTNELLKQFGSLLVASHDTLLDSLLDKLGAGKPSVRKRTSTNLASLAPYLNDNGFNKLVSTLITGISPDGNKNSLQAAVRVLAATSRTAGTRLGPFLSQIYPHIERLAAEAEEQDELREGCLQAIESFVLRCPQEITVHLQSAISLSLKYISYDPNYSDDMDEDDEDEEMEDSEEEDDGSGDESVGDYSDDDDMSWKVRRGSTKILSAVILNRPELITQLYDQVAPTLVKRFREREENVRLDVISAFVDLVRQTAFVSARRVDDNDGSNHTLSLLVALLPTVIKATKRLFAEKSVKTRLGTFSLLKEIANVVPAGSLTDHITILVKGCVDGIREQRHANPNSKIEALVLLRLILQSHPAQAFQPHLDVVTSAVCTAVNESYYKITSEALRTSCAVIGVLRPVDGSPPSPDLAKYAQSLHEATLPRIKATDQDQEIKETAITLAGLLVAHLGDVLQSDLPTILKLLLDRLENEITRLPTVRVLGTISQSEIQVNIDSIFEPAIPALASFLRKSNRALRQGTLQTLKTIIERHSAKLTSSHATTVLSEMVTLIDDADLQLAHLALQVAAAIIRASDLINAGDVKTTLLPQLITIVTSPLVQGAALDSLLVVFTEITRKAGGEMTVTALCSALLESSKNPKLTPQGRQSLAKALGVIATNGTPADLTTMVNHFLTALKQQQGVELTLPLLTLGEIGARTDLATFQNVDKSIVALLESQNEEIKMAASLALGNLAVGNLKVFVPFILSQMEASKTHHYLLLHSLKETIARQSTDSSAQLQPFLDTIVSLLFTHAESEEEGLRNVVSECLGKLSIAHASTLVPRLLEATRSDRAPLRASAISALKFAFNDNHLAADKAFASSVAEFLSLLSDSKPAVSRAALVVFNCIAHNRPAMVHPLLPTLLPVLYKHTEKDPSLVREVEMGPFKHKVDDGLELRKAAFECMDTLLSTSLAKLDLFPFIEHLALGLADEYDIKLSCHLMLSRLTRASGARVLAAVDKIIPSLKKTLNAKASKNAVEQEVTRHNDMIRSALRALIAMMEVPGSSSKPDFRLFVEEVEANPVLQEKLLALQAEQGHVVGGGSDHMDTS